MVIGPKSSIHTFQNYLIIVSPPFVPSAASQSATVRNLVNRNNGKDRSATTDIARVGIFQLEHKFVAHSSAFDDGVRDVFVQWGKVYVLSNEGKVRFSNLIQ